MACVKYLLMTGGVGMIVVASAILGYDLRVEMRYGRAPMGVESKGLHLHPVQEQRWRTGLAFAFLAWAPILLACCAL